jgi:hypothetical protein
VIFFFDDRDVRYSQNGTVAVKVKISRTFGYIFVHQQRVSNTDEKFNLGVTC